MTSSVRFLYMCMHNSVVNNLSRLTVVILWSLAACEVTTFGDKGITSREEIVTHGAVSMFDLSTEDWTTYTE